MNYSQKALTSIDMVLLVFAPPSSPPPLPAEAPICKNESRGILLPIMQNLQGHTVANNAKLAFVWGISTTALKLHRNNRQAAVVEKDWKVS